MWPCLSARPPGLSGSGAGQNRVHHPRWGLHGRHVEPGLPATLGPSGLGWLISVLRDAGDPVGWLGGSTEASEWTFNQLSFYKGQPSFHKGHMDLAVMR